MKVAFGFFTGASAIHLDRYPIYGLVLVLGLAIESVTRNQEKLASNLFRPSFFDQHGISVRQTIFSCATLFLYLAAAKDGFISRTVLAFGVPLIYLVLLGSNYFLPPILARWIFWQGRVERALLIGPSSRASRIHAWLSGREAFGVRAAGILCPESDSALPALPRLGDCEDLESVLVEHSITQVIFLGLPDSTEVHERMVEVLESHGIRILILSNLEEKLRHRTVHFEDAGMNFITLREEPLENPLNRLLKRMLDVAISGPIVLLLLPPVGLLVWVLQRLQSPGPLLYRQVRDGLQNREFNIVKFRTMHVNKCEAVQATDGDSRIYPAGRWLRRLSLDELPQFWNVLTGVMSICGPRPHLVQHNADFAQRMVRYHLRTFVKPGITGLAQVRGFRGEIRSVEDIEHRLESDIEYLEHWRLALDLAIIFRTGLQVILFAGNGLFRRRQKESAQKAATAHAMPEMRVTNGVRRIYTPEALRRSFRQILGIRFFTGSAAEAVALGMKGGLMVAPSAPVLLGLEEDSVHRVAVRGSALAITDSGLMVFLWKLLTGEDITRVSGLVYLKLLLEQKELRVSGATFWVMPSTSIMKRNVAWLQEIGIPVTEGDCYIAPQYARGEPVTDAALVEAVNRARPSHVIMAVGGGVQEKLGAELLRRLDYRPAVHCTGAAIGFLSGEQARIPMWADRCRLGWLFRCLDEPAKFVPRYWEARRLFGLMLQYHGRLPGGDVQSAGESGGAMEPILGGAAGSLVGPH